LVTLHRRENASSVRAATDAIKQVIASHPDVEVLWVLHLNGIRKKVISELEGVPSVQLLEPQSYKAFVHLMKASHFILSDSGGVQEEAPALGKPVLVLRGETERMEAVEAGSSMVVGCATASIRDACCRLLRDADLYATMSRKRSLFGDGQASVRILQALNAFYRFEIGSPFLASWPPARHTGEEGLPQTTVA
jgi:UDP-N-acetylglucosamine 2-epimerase (non-hydrolysing)